jgi:hypothetical protein
MLYCEMFIVSHALGNGASSSVIGISEWVMAV